MTANPYKHLRELTLTSQKDFAAKYGMSKTTMTFIESGQLPALSDHMILSLGEECIAKHVDGKQVLRDDFNAQTLQEAYQAWKSNERVANAHLFQKPITGSAADTVSPFATYVQDVAGTQQRFCKMLKVPASAVHMYATGKTLTMPKVTEEALQQVQFQLLSELKSVQTDWLGLH